MLALDLAAHRIDGELPMSASVLVWLPIGLLAVVSLVCFVGCDVVFDLDRHPFTRYSDETILSNPALVAYWPLGEAPGETTAVELKGGRNGSYVTAAPYVAVSGAFPSATASGQYVLGEAGIVTGDAVQPGNLINVRTTCVEVDGGYVNVPFDPAIYPAGAFTIEVWVRVEWLDVDSPAYRCILDGRSAFGGNKGFALFANSSNHWEAWVGNGGTGASGWTVLPTNDPFPLSTDGLTFYVAATYDGTTLNIYVDGEQRAGGVATAYVPNDNASPAAPSPLYIGTGAPFLPLGPQPAGGPQWPFRGRIQSVAIYNAALSLDDIIKHKANGEGVST
jgi:hypothetical protein